jgi:protein-L-isoaspartate(D-aspartate) O-methyltransferase
MKTLTDEHLAIFRRHMVEVIGIHVDLASEEIGKQRLDHRVMAAMSDVPRHLFVPTQIAAAAYHDTPLPIGFNKTISQPFMVALMTDLLELQSADHVLEVGTGLGYQTAVLARLVDHVWSVEIVEEFVESAQNRLRDVGIENVTIRIGDGSRGWVEHAPYDKILAAAAAREVPKALIAQLKPGGRLVLPLGPADDQRLSLVHKSADESVDIRQIMPVRFSDLET